MACYDKVEILLSLKNPMAMVHENPPAILAKLLEKRLGWTVAVAPHLHKRAGPVLEHHLHSWVQVSPVSCEQGQACLKISRCLENSKQGRRIAMNIREDYNWLAFHAASVAEFWKKAKIFRD